MPPPYLSAIADARDAIEAKLLATLSGSQRLASDLRLDLEQIPAGSTRFQLRAYQTGISDDPESAESDVPVIGVQVSVHHYLSSTERAYTEGVMESELHTQMDPGFWRDIPEVRGVESPPSLSTTDVGRTGKVVSYSYTVFVAVQIF